MKYASDIVGEFSRKTGIKDPKLDVMLQQQKERNVLWLPRPSSWGEFNLNATTNSAEHAEYFGVDLGSEDFEPITMWFFDECTTTREEFDKRYHGGWSFDDAFKRGFEHTVDAEWRDVTNIKALPPRCES